MNFPALLSINLTLFLLIICGWLCRRWDIIDTAASKKLSKLILSIGQPMLIIASLNNAEYSPENLRLAGQVTLLGFGLHIFVAASAYFLCKLIKRNFNKAKIFEFSLVFGNCGFIGFPILDSLLGKGFGSFLGAFYVISFHLFFWTWGILIFARGRDDIKLTPKKIFLNFGTVPCAIGVLLYFLKPIFVTPDFIGNFMNYMGNLCTPISVLVTGALLATISLRRMFTDWKLYLHSLLKLILFPLAVCVLATVIGLPELLILLATAMAAVPCGASVSMLAELYDIEPAYASQTVGMTSILSTVTLPVIMLAAQWIVSFI